MTPIMKSLGIDQMPRDAKLALVQEIWDTIASEAGAIPLSEAQRRELERRAAEDDAHPEDVTPWEEVKAETLAKLRK
jgi:putative addiction module component (TIGR02574 family)